jgi:23S rRNA pseudouridine1911/1915/1917 synthase
MTGPGAVVRELTVPDGAIPVRVDRYVTDATGLSRSHVQKLIAAGNLTGADGEPLRSNVIVGAGVHLRLLVPEAIPLALEPEPDIVLRVVYEDDDLLIVDKPAGLVVHPSPGHSTGTMVHALLGRQGGAEYGGIAGVARPGIVHRLDRDTSGLLVVARSQEAWELLTAALRRREIDRRYVALVHGRPASRRGTIEAPIGRDEVDGTRMAIGGSSPRDAVTHFELRELLTAHALLDLRLETGRTHQIRVHLRGISLPVVGDPLYGLHHAPTLGLERQFLHARSLAFAHPLSGEPLRFESEVPGDLAAALELARAV